MTPEQAIAFLAEAAKFFQSRAQHTDEDRAFWANHANADNCNRVADLIRTLTAA